MATNQKVGGSNPSRHATKGNLIMSSFYYACSGCDLKGRPLRKRHSVFFFGRVSRHATKRVERLSFLLRKDSHPRVLPSIFGDNQSPQTESFSRHATKRNLILSSFYFACCAVRFRSVRLTSTVSRHEHHTPCALIFIRQAKSG